MVSAGAALQRRSGWSIFRRVMGEMRGYRPHLCGIALLGVCMAPLGLLNLAAIQVVVDSYLGEKPLQYYTAWLMPTALTRWSERSGYLVFAGGLILLGVLLNQGFGFGQHFERGLKFISLVVGSGEQQLGAPLLQPARSEGFCHGLVSLDRVVIERILQGCQSTVGCR